MSRYAEIALGIFGLVVLRFLTGSIWLAIAIMLPVDVWVFPWLRTRYPVKPNH